MKQNASETDSNWRFKKKPVKACLQNKKVYRMLHSRHSHFHLILIFPLKMVELLQQHANTVYWLQALLLPIIAKSSILNMAEFLDSFLKTLPCTKTSLVLCEFQSFLLLFQNAATFVKSHWVFLCYFLQPDEAFLISLQMVANTILFLWSQSMIVQSQIQIWLVYL